jgi:hypothetical protein
VIVQAERNEKTETNHLKLEAIAPRVPEGMPENLASAVQRVAATILKRWLVEGRA